MNNPIPFVSAKNLDYRLLKEIKEELGLKSSQRVTTMLKRIFCDLQRILSFGEIEIMTKRLPDCLSSLFPSEIPKSDSQLFSYDHLDQWTEKLSSEDQSSTEKIFYSEINALRALIMTLTRLDNICGLFAFHGLKSSLIREVKQACV